MKTRFIMIRHGLSLANEQKRFAGNLNFELADLGHRQAELCAEALKNEKIDAIYASDLQRAYCTAAPLGRIKGIEVIPCKGLREIFAGEWEGKTFDELCSSYSEAYTVWREDVGRAKCTGGESVVELSKRVLGTLGEIAEQNPDKTVCIATHATPIRAVCTAAAGLDVCDMAEIKWVSNASISIFDYEDGAFTAVSVDNTDHLGSLITGFPSNV